MVKKGEFMFKKLGQIKSTESEAPHLETEEGKVYKEIVNELISVNLLKDLEATAA